MSRGNRLRNSTGHSCSGGGRGRGGRKGQSQSSGAAVSCLIQGVGTDQHCFRQSRGGGAAAESKGRRCHEAGAQSGSRHGCQRGHPGRAACRGLRRHRWKLSSGGNSTAHSRGWCQGCGCRGECACTGGPAAGGGSLRCLGHRQCRENCRDGDAGGHAGRCQGLRCRGYRETTGRHDTCSRGHCHLSLNDRRGHVTKRVTRGRG